MFSIYPMKFKPILREKIWGGQKIGKKFGIIDEKIDKCGEAWVLSAVKGYESEIENGHFAGNTVAEMVEIYMDDLIGEEMYAKYGYEFPLLIKIIDANDYLSVQVHPNDEIAQKKHKLRFGKSEMWYVLQADPGAHIVSGFNREMSREELLKHIDAGSLKSVLNFEPVNTGDLIYLPAGTVHALGPGLMIAEIQQSSDITYRLYDWDRKDKEGNHRELHLRDASDAIDYSLKPGIIKGFNPEINQTTPMMKTEYFSTSFIHLQSKVEKILEHLDSFVIYFALSGIFELEFDNGKIHVAAGECVLIPAITDKVVLHPKPAAHVLEILPG